ncbi:MAG: ethanolamine ammonia-lyase subunit EutB, partial [Methylobacteriaceae bacterium]
FHDQLYIREVLGLRRAPEFEEWLARIGLTDADGTLLPGGAEARLLTAAPELAA